VTGILNAERTRAIRLPEDCPPRLLVVVDTEEEFDWRQPHSRENTAVTAIGAQGPAQAVFDRYGIVPTYVIDYPVASNPRAVAALRQFYDRGTCRIGTHLHPWVNPPHLEPVTAFNSYPGNLSAALEQAKLERLTATIAEAFGVAPSIYKAGRYGIGPGTATILDKLGYKIDVSVVPFTNFSADGGPDFSGCGFEPWWFGSRGDLLEIPLSCGFYGLLRSVGPALYPRLVSRAGMCVRLPGLLARSKLLERIRLTPEGVDLAANIRLTRSLYNQGCRIFTLTYHSPSLVPGMTPYVCSESGLSAFLATIDRFCAFFVDELGGKPSDPQEVYNLLSDVKPRTQQLAQNAVGGERN
jgi:hypothetical protein